MKSPRLAHTISKVLPVIGQSFRRSPRWLPMAQAAVQQKTGPFSF